jgi:MFS family permease
MFHVGQAATGLTIFFMPVAVGAFMFPVGRWQECFSLEHFGAIFGLTFAAYGFVTGPLGPTLSGYLLDVTGDNFRLVFVYLGIFCLLAGLFIRGVVPPHCNR